MTTLTTKELTGIEDQLTSEETLISKCKLYASTAQDAAIKAKLEEMAQKHQQHFDKLYSLLG